MPCCVERVLERVDPQQQLPVPAQHRQREHAGRGEHDDGEHDAGDEHDDAGVRTGCAIHAVALVPGPPAMHERRDRGQERVARERPRPAGAEWS